MTFLMRKIARFILLGSIAINCITFTYFIFVQPFRRTYQLRLLEISSFENSQPHNFRFPNKLITDYDDYVRGKLKRFDERKTQADDAELVELARQMMDEPSGTEPKLSEGVRGTKQSEIIDKYLEQMRGGKFIECGGYDGELSSPTLFLERKRGWTGLLIEADPAYYTQLLGKQRNVYSINACLNPYPYFSLLKFNYSTYEGMGGQYGKLVKNLTKDSDNTTVTIPCFPAETLLLALNWTTIDFFSLDVEGMELPVLRTIPWDKLNIRTLTVEYKHGKEGPQAYKDYMNQTGYFLHESIRFDDPHREIYITDFVFVKEKKGTSLVRR